MFIQLFVNQYIAVTKIHW